jgi:ribosomal subunit interface protein
MGMPAENTMATLPLEITFRDFEPSDAVREAIHLKTQKLSKFFDKIVNCHVTVSAPHRHKSKGKKFHIQIELNVPGKSIIVSHDPGDHDAHEDFYITLRDAFNAAEKQLKHFVENLKNHHR